MRIEKKNIYDHFLWNQYHKHREKKKKISRKKKSYWPSERRRTANIIGCTLKNFSVVTPLTHTRIAHKLCNTQSSTNSWVCDYPYYHTKKNPSITYLQISQGINIHANFAFAMGTKTIFILPDFQCSFYLVSRVGGIDFFFRGERE